MSSKDTVDAKTIPDDRTDAKPHGAGEGKMPQLPGQHMPPLPRSAGETMMTAEEFFADEYKMDYPNRGRAIIINNKTFDRSLGLGERTGTDQDAIALHQRCEEMGFDVDMYQDLRCEDMRQVLSKASQNENYNQESDCFMCAILSHGEEGVVFGIDSKIETKLLLEPFKGNNCNSLVGKPKIFIIQACQGSQFDGGVHVDVADAKSHMSNREIQVHKIPSEADFLIAYSVVPGYFSWRNSANGSWFIQALSSVLAQNWQSLDLLTIMTRVNKKVAYEFESRTGKEFMNQKKQIPCITSMLTKEVRFKSKK
ncbi:caspase-3-like [Mya arenaria]|uniref:caspase-3-like n=1 Tax=Mya arenaria TaxID=6604 RepID=UPI0022E34983|nr:caspase-3-like [Mya arenaria]